MIIFTTFSFRKIDTQMTKREVSADDGEGQEQLLPSIWLTYSINSSMTQMGNIPPRSYLRDPAIQESGGLI